VEDQILSFYESAHQKELEYKETLMSRLQITAALLLTNGSAFIYMLRNLDFNSGAIYIHFFYLFAGLNFIAIVIACYFLARAFSSSEYKSLPTLQTINQYIVELNEYNKNIDEFNQTNNSTEDTINVETKFSDYLKDTYVDCATFNAIANERRSSFSYRGVIATLSAFLPLFICSILFIADDMDASSARKPTDVSAVKIEASLEKISQHLLNSNKEPSCQKLPNAPQNLQFNLKLLLPDSLEKVTYRPNHCQQKEVNDACTKTK
jgi:hypothetical protein